jgi:hypothetical protein
MKLFGNYWKRKYLSEIFETINAAGVLQVPLVIMMMMIMEFQFMQNIKPQDFREMQRICS